MEKFAGRLTGVCLLIGIALATFVGCSTDVPTQSNSTTADLTQPSTAQLPPPPSSSTQFVAVIETLDLDLRQLTFVDCETVVYVADDCQIVQVVAGIETEIELADIVQGDRVKVCGLVQDDGTVLAHKIVMYSGEEFCYYDLAFRDTIATLDYDGGSFTVMNKFETIIVDEQTIIWGIETSWREGWNDHEPPNSPDGFSRSDDEPNREHEISYALTDLQPGFVIEVKANIVDENTLYAANIKLANTSLKVCTRFEARLASIDLGQRVVTFADNNWLGLVCKGATLTDTDGLPIALEDFLIQDLVFVKGFPVSDGGDSLKVCEMSKLE